MGRYGLWHQGPREAAIGTVAQSLVRFAAVDFFNAQQTAPYLQPNKYEMVFCQKLFDLMLSTIGLQQRREGIIPLQALSSLVNNGDLLKTGGYLFADQPGLMNRHASLAKITGELFGQRIDFKAHLDPEIYDPIYDRESAYGGAIYQKTAATESSSGRLIII